jgi:hypothetical protein
MVSPSHCHMFWSTLWPKVFTCSSWCITIIFKCFGTNESVYWNYLYSKFLSLLVAKRIANWWYAGQINCLSGHKPIFPMFRTEHTAVILNCMLVGSYMVMLWPHNWRCVNLSAQIQALLYIYGNLVFLYGPKINIQWNWQTLFVACSYASEI